MADKNNSQPDVNEQIKVRMDKLAALQEAGKDPFQITKYDVTHHTDEIRAIYEAHEKELLGDRPAVNTDGMDEQQAREAVNADYNELRQRHRPAHPALPLHGRPLHGHPACP